jgi:hypothetical protein
MIMNAMLLVVVSLASAIGPAGGQEGPAPRPPDIGMDLERFRVVDLDPDAVERLEPLDELPEGLFTVSVRGAEVPMLGRVRVEGGTVWFDPRYKPRHGVTYRATFRPGLIPGADPDAPPVVRDLTIADYEIRQAVVEAVYPSADRLPENLLRFYLHFSAPMSRGEAYDRIRLLDADGEPIEAAFLELDEELWDPSGTRFTLLIDPGRIKQGLVPRAELGAVLEAGKRYTLEVDAGWPDASGQPMLAPFRKRFTVGPPDESPPDPTTWRLDVPEVAHVPLPFSRVPVPPLTVRFPEPLDHALVGRLLSVVDAEGRPVPGQGEVIDGETGWRFNPGRHWRPGEYRLEVDTDLEDRAGNAVGRPFEVDVFDRVERQVEARSVAVPFRIGPG